MDRKFDASLEEGDGYTYLGLDGVIDEDNTLAKLANRIQGDVLVLDLAGVERINSCGVRDWVNWQHNIAATGIRVVMIRCSPAIISQVNMVTNFIGDAVIHSFHAPYFNPETEEEKSVLLFTKDVIGQQPVRAPEVYCEDTGYQLEFDDFEESYFAFASTASDPSTLDAEVIQLVESLTPELAQNNATSSARTRPIESPTTGDVPTSPNTPAANARAGVDSQADTRSVPSNPAEASPTTRPETPRQRAPATPATGAPSQQEQPPPEGGEDYHGPPSALSSGHFVTDPRAASGGLGLSQGSDGFVEPLEAESRSSAVVIGILGVVLVAMLGLLLWLTFS